jgi:lipoic acid synthetase
MKSASNPVSRLPRWMKAEMPGVENYTSIRKLLSAKGLHTVCESAGCPNKGECWNRGTATFMILGDKCTRNCKFCQVYTRVPDAVDPAEPERLAEAVRIMKLKHAVITSVARDDLPDGGASHWVRTIHAVKKMNPGTTMEVLIPDFRKNFAALDAIVDAHPEVISHNLETIRRLSPLVRSVAKYEGSLEVISYISRSGIIAKTGIMAGLGETFGEVLECMDDALKAGAKVFTIGQYLQPGPEFYPVREYVQPSIFKAYREKGLAMGFRYVESSPLVRSSYHAERHICT